MACCMVWPVACDDRLVEAVAARLRLPATATASFSQPAAAEPMDTPIRGGAVAELRLIGPSLPAPCCTTLIPRPAPALRAAARRSGRGAGRVCAAVDAGLPCRVAASIAHAVTSRIMQRSVGQTRPAPCLLCAPSHLPAGPWLTPAFFRQPQVSPPEGGGPRGAGGQASDAPISESYAAGACPPVGATRWAAAAANRHARSESRAGRGSGSGIHRTPESSAPTRPRPCRNADGLIRGGVAGGLDVGGACGRDAGGVIGRLEPGWRGAQVAEGGNSKQAVRFRPQRSGGQWVPRRRRLDPLHVCIGLGPAAAELAHARAVSGVPGGAADGGSGMRAA